MRKTGIVLLSLLCASGLAFAANDASSSTASKPWVDKGSLLADVGVGWGGLSVGAEYDLVPTRRAPGRYRHRRRLRRESMSPRSEMFPPVWT